MFIETQPVLWLFKCEGTDWSDKILFVQNKQVL